MARKQNSHLKFRLWAWFVGAWALALQGGCFLPYVIKQGYYQSMLLNNAAPLAKAIERDGVTEEQRKKIELVVATKKFAEEEMGFSPSESYTTANLTWAHPLYNITASEALRFEPYTWWFPFMGRVPYLGFFDKKDAEKQREELVAKHYDVLMRPVSAYSTLGYFKDPILPSMLERSDLGLVDLIIHELAHGQVYWANQTAFNESFANATGHFGALMFFRKRFGEDSREYRDAKAYYADLERYEKFMWGLYQTLDSHYRKEIPDEEKFDGKKKIFADVSRQFAQVPFLTESFKRARVDDLSNANLMSFKLYNTGQKTFECLLERTGVDWRRYLGELKKLEHEPDPFMKLKQVVRELGGDKTCGD